MDAACFKTVIFTVNTNEVIINLLSFFHTTDHSLYVVSNTHRFALKFHVLSLHNLLFYKA